MNTSNPDYIARQACLWVDKWNIFPDIFSKRESSKCLGGVLGLFNYFNIKLSSASFPKPAIIFGYKRIIAWIK